ncbi:MAG: methylamine dehydrogenase accessory protein MauD [Lysobacterales bacterium]
MENALIVSLTVLWIVVIALVLVVIALARQIGVLHERIAPAGALATGNGPKVGEASPSLTVQDITGATHQIGPQGIPIQGATNIAGEKSRLIFFLSPTCPVCKTLLPALRSSARAERSWLEVMLASDGDPDKQQAFVEREKLSEFPYVLSTELGMTFQVEKLPYAVLIDEQGTVRAKGLVNSREHLESLFEAKKQGIASIQEYFQQQG